jgi:hypothetical protein
MTNGLLTVVGQGKNSFKHQFGTFVSPKLRKSQGYYRSTGRIRQACSAAKNRGPNELGSPEPGGPGPNERERSSLEEGQAHQNDSVASQPGGCGILRRSLRWHRSTWHSLIAHHGSDPATEHHLERRALRSTGRRSSRTERKGRRTQWHLLMKLSLSRLLGSQASKGAQA